MDFFFTSLCCLSVPLTCWMFINISPFFVCCIWREREREMQKLLIDEWEVSGCNLLRRRVLWESRDVWEVVRLWVV
jgi:hypothetical protein